MREMTSTEAKVNFGEVLESIVDGPVVITRNGRKVATIISTPDRAPRNSRSTEPLLKLYAAGRLGRADLEEETGLHFGEIILAMRVAGLTLPRVRTLDRLNAAQRALYDQVFRA